MGKDLVIVESPAKARTIGRILGPAYKVTSSLGHVRDLPQGRFGVRITDTFTPEYLIPKDKSPVVTEIRELARDANSVYLATDPDREGEAISWHLVQAAQVNPDQIKRVVFHEITEQAVKEAFLSPREIDMDLVDAQQARRILDRLVGYSLSPLVSKKLRWWGLSAGRVQSAALRIVVDQERRIQAFVPEEYWSVEVIFISPNKGKVPKTFTGQVYSLLGNRQKLVIPNKTTAETTVAALENAEYQVSKIETKTVINRPAAPFITSTLQQEAYRKLRLATRRTMSVAQQLYEGIALGSDGSTGLITYMRTDSTNVSETAVQEARSYIRATYGVEYLPKQPRVFNKKVKRAQEAHEAIRPTSVMLTPDKAKPFLDRDQSRLYELIWRRFVASQMADAKMNRTRVQIDATTGEGMESYLVTTTGTVLLFSGFRELYFEDRDETTPEQEETPPLPILATGQLLRKSSVGSAQHFTKAPPRYSEASLVRALEDRAIGRPSTYAAIVSTIQDREYVQRDGGRLSPTLLGTVVNDLLVDHFANIVDLNFTASMEDELDQIAQGEQAWQTVLKDFYDPFVQTLEIASESIPKLDIQTDEICETCNRPMNLKRSRWGSTFLSCSGFPECRTARSTVPKVGVDCPDCGGDLVQRQARKGKRRNTFYGCSNYPNCKFLVSQRPTPEPCPECSGLLVQVGRDKTKCVKCAYQSVMDNPDPVDVAG